MGMPLSQVGEEETQTCSKINSLYRACKSHISFKTAGRRTIADGMEAILKEVSNQRLEKTHLVERMEENRSFSSMHCAKSEAKR